MTQPVSDKDFLEYVVKALVDNPDDVEIERRVDEMGVLLLLKVSPKDMGQIIGKAGSTAKSIRNLIRIIGLKHQARVNLKIEEPVGGQRASEGEEQPKKETTDNLDDLNL